VIIEPTRPCHECGETDHLAKDCPSKKPRNCLVCNVEGHIAADCPALIKLQKGNSLKRLDELIQRTNERRQ
jgi:predicted nucleic acid binding AN1-type Zn finger protein